MVLRLTCAQGRPATLEWSISSKFCPPVAHKKVCYMGVAPASSKFYIPVAHKKSATLDWPCTLLNFTLGWLTKGLLD